MRISEEEDRRTREHNTRERLPKSLEELKRALNTCVDMYQQAFGDEAAEMYEEGSKVRVVVREEQAANWQSRGTVEVSLVATLPGFQIDRPGQPPSLIEVGMLAGDKFFYKDRERDEYLSLEDLTKRVLDRMFFPKLRD